MRSVVRPCSCSFLTTLHIGAPEEGLLSSSFSLLLPTFSSLAADRCCPKSKVTGAGVSPDCLISAPRGVVGSAPRMDLACQLRRSWRSSRLPTSLWSHQSSLMYSATAWTHATWTARTLSGTTPYVLVSDRCLASAALAFFMHRLWCCVRTRTPASGDIRMRLHTWIRAISKVGSMVRFSIVIKDPWQDLSKVALTRPMT
jgi:hypothetical protein